jgi:hypothetical protein
MLLYEIRMLRTALTAYNDVDKNFDFPMFHQAVAHLLLFVEYAGSPNNARAGVFEIRHNDVHDLYNRTNKRDFIPQLCALVILCSLF